MSRRSSDSFSFDSLRLEGGFFVPAILEKIALGEHSAQKAADYKLPQGLSLIDEQGRAFRIASTLWKNFAAARARADLNPAAVTRGFAVELLRDAFGYADIAPAPGPVALGDRAFPVTAFAVGGRIPVIIAPHTLGLDEPDECFAIAGSGARRRSAHQLAQQFLNANPDATWALVTNGARLRLVRDADTLTRPAFLEADLELVLRPDANRYPDFAALWRVFHASRASDADATCVWENWRREGQEQGERVREGLRNGVTHALLALGTGFLAHPANDTLRASLQSGALTTDGYFQQLLRLIYRCLFLFTIEDRELLHDLRDDSEAKRRARETYAQGYALRRLRDRALRHSGFDRHHDLWEGVRVVFRGLANGEPRLDLPALGGLFAPAQCPALDAARLENRALLAAMRHLRWSNRNGQYAPIDYRNMGPEELGSVYESLLELVPSIDLSSRQFGFVGITEEGSTDGNARKTTGSYYTPDNLVRELLDSALAPVIAKKIAAAPADPAAALLSISVIDPACGSGHFLLAAARRLAEKLAELRAADGAVTPADYRHALREVIARCIHGVDRNPMALELARTALWLEGYEPGLALSFLDHHLVCGDALLGLANLGALAKGIPADAFKPLAGDSKAFCKTLASANRAALKELEARSRNRGVFEVKDTQTLLDELRRTEAMPETTPAEVEAKACAYQKVHATLHATPEARAADIYVAAFLSPKVDGAICPTTDTLADLLYPVQGHDVPDEMLANARHLCADARALHWPLAFPQIFLSSQHGFDCVLGNPPWERIKLQEEEFFAVREPLVAAAKNKAERAQRIRWLSEGSLAFHLLHTEIPHGGHPAEKQLYNDFTTARRTAEAMSVFAHVAGSDAGRYPLTGVGDVNTYALFAETITAITHRDGRSGFIVPTGIATDDSTKAFFSNLAENGRLASLYDFENREKLFPAVDSRMKFCLMTLGPASSADFAFFLTQTEQLDDERRHFALSRDEFRLINPNTRTCPIFRSNADAELTKKIYRHVPVLIQEANGDQPEQNPWGISFSRLFDMANDSDIFIGAPAPGALPLYEAKMMHQFDHRWASYGQKDGKLDALDVTDAQKADPAFAIRPRYWVEERHVLARIARVPRCLTRAIEMPDTGGWDTVDETAVRHAFANWIEAARAADDLSGFSPQAPRDHVMDCAGRHFAALSSDTAEWLDAKAIAEAKTHAPLSDTELALLRDAPALIDAARQILDRRSPRWLMGWRDITNATNERTVIASLVPRTAVGHTLPLFFVQPDARYAAAFLGNWCSLVFDYVARQKIGGTHLTYGYLKQFPVLPPTAYTQADLDYVVPRVLELTYTAHDMKPWASDLGHTGAPFAFDPDRRAILRAELDARYARLYGLTRDELRYILDPAETHGADYPTETFRGLKSNETKQHGEYRTQRLVLEAWDAAEKEPTAGLVKTPATQSVSVPPPDWMDRPLVLPALPRGRISPALYRAAVVAHLLYQSGGRLSFDQFRRAYWLLSEPKTLLRYARGEIGREATKWAQGFHDQLEKDQFIPHLRGAVRYDLQFITVSDERWLQLRRTDHISNDEHVIFDARLALLVADLWPSDEPISTLTQEEELAIKELELIA